MTEDRNEILQVLFGALAEFNQDLAHNNPIQLSEHSSLEPGQAPLDSLGFVNLVSIVESHLERRFGVVLQLSEAAEHSNPWQSVGALADFLAARLEV